MTNPSEANMIQPGTGEERVGPLSIDDGQFVADMARLVFLSYRFSQGAIGTQNRMLLYIENHFHPDIFEQAHVERLREKAKGMIGPYFLNQATHPATAIPWDDDSPEAAVKTPLIVTNEVAGLFERFTTAREILDGFDDNPTGIAQSVIVLDHDYLTRPGGRAGDSHALKIAVSPYARDPYESMFIKYGLNGHTTTTQEFDEIFATATSEETIRKLDPHTLALLVEVIDIYNTNHSMETTARIRRTKEICMEVLHG